MTISTESFTASPIGSVTFRRSSPVLLCADNGRTHNAKNNQRPMITSAYPMDRAILQKWLKSGYMEKHTFHETTEGTPQGGISSPALANMALDGLERLLKEKYPSRPLKSLGNKNPSVNSIRYANDFIVTSGSKDLLEKEIKPLIEQFL